MRIWGFPSSPDDVREYHTAMMAPWLARAGKAVTKPDGTALTEQEQANVGVYLREWYPYIYLWGPRGDVLRENYERILAKLNATKKTTWKSFMPNMMMHYHDLPVNESEGKYTMTKRALRLYGDFCGIMGDEGIWSPVITATDSGNFAVEALIPGAYPKHLYWQVHMHDGWDEAMHLAFKKTTDQILIERGLRWFDMLVLGGEHIATHPELGESYAQHVAFCQEHDLLP